MCESDYSSDEDNIHARQLVSGLPYELKPFNFTCYETCGDKKEVDLGVPLTGFDKSNLSLVRDELNPNNFNILYDGHKLRVFLKAFPALAKRSKFYQRKKCIKVKDKC